MGNGKEKKNTAIIASNEFSVDAIFKREKTYFITFGLLKLEVRMLNAADLAAAEHASTIPGDNPNEPKHDDAKRAEELLARCVIGWQHEDGKTLMYEGKELECTAKNIMLFCENYTGLAKFIFDNVKSADQMHKTVKAEEIKN